MKLRYALLVLLLAPNVLASDEEPLHRRVDRLIAAGAGEVVAEPAGDAEFLRRVYLDLAGRIPSVEEAKAFLADNSEDKRRRLIDALLESDDYPRRMQELFHVMLMERRGDHEEWTKFLREAFARNLPWDRIAAALIKPDADDETLRGAAYFLTARLVSEGAMAPVDVPGLTRDVGRLLAGVDLGCAQCHDHISIDDYKQRDFQGLHVIYENLQSRRDTEFPAVAEKLMTEKKEFMSVFILEPTKTGPRVPGGEEIEIPTFPDGEEYAVAPDRKKRTPGVPKFSPLAELAKGLAKADNELFVRNIANRLWFTMLGRGLVEPLDLQHGENPPSHPELLDLLAGEFAAYDFDIKWLLRELALTECYGRSGAMPGAGSPPAPRTYALANEKRMSAEQLFASVLMATGEGTVGDPLDERVAKSEELQDLRELFVDSFANPPKEPEVDFEPSVQAALFLMHDNRIQKLLEAKAGNLTDRLSKLSDPEQVAEELFLAVLSRRPTKEDVADVRQHLEANANRREEALSDLAWALLASTEFCVNH